MGEMTSPDDLIQAYFVSVFEVTAAGEQSQYDRQSQFIFRVATLSQLDAQVVIEEAVDAESLGCLDDDRPSAERSDRQIGQFVFDSISLREFGMIHQLGEGYSAHRRRAFSANIQ